jgi:uncharacterized phage infection (PIP) family protein YhgE
VLDKKNNHVSLVFVAITIVLVLVVVSVGTVGYVSNNSLQASYNELETNYQNLNSTYIQLQSSYASAQRDANNKANTIQELQSELNSLNDQVQSLKSQLSSAQSTVQTQTSTISSQNSQITNLQSQITTLNGNIASLQTQLSNATSLIAQIHGPTGILPTYSDLSYVGPMYSGGAYWLQLSLKNTETLPITQIYVTINSVAINMPFTYLDGIVSASNPLPAYQTATGKMNVTPPVNNAGTYSLVIQAITNNGIVYTYQTTIST